MTDSSLFRRQLKGWLPCVLLTAAPSFVAAYAVEFNRVQSVIGMLAGILIFWWIFAWVWSSGWFRRRVPEGGAWDKAFTYATWVRSAFGVMGFVGVLLCLGHPKAPPPWAVPFLLLLVPDLCAGMLSGFFISWAVQSPLVRAVRIMIAGTDAHERSQSLAVGDVNSLLPTFVTTLAQGLLLTLTLLFLALVCRGFLWANAQWNARRGLTGTPTAALT